MYSRYISSLTRFSSILDPTGFPGNFSILAISSCVFISRVSRFFSSLYSIHAAVFSYSFIFLWMIPLFPLTVLFYSPFFFFSFFLFFFFFFFLRTPFQADFLRSILRSLIRTPDTLFLLESFCSALHLPAFCLPSLFSTVPRLFREQ